VPGGGCQAGEAVIGRVGIFAGKRLSEMGFQLAQLVGPDVDQAEDRWRGFQLEAPPGFKEERFSPGDRLVEGSGGQQDIQLPCRLR